LIDIKINNFNLNLPSDHYCHLLLSVGLQLIEYPHQHWGTYVGWIQQCQPNHYAGQKLWLVDDLTASISARTDTEREPENGKIVLSVGVIDIHCALHLYHVNRLLSFLLGARCQREAWTDLYNNTSMASLLGAGNRANRLVLRLCGTCGEPVNTRTTSGPSSTEH
jgi:hypothetical protein